MGRRKIYDDRTKYINEWTKNNRERISLKIPKEEKAAIQGFAKYLNLSTTAFILLAVNEFKSAIYDKADKESQKEILDNIEEYINLRKEKKAAQEE